jgi:chromatin remodeling complex protein RSC6
MTPNQSGGMGIETALLCIWGDSGCVGLNIEQHSRRIARPPTTRSRINLCSGLGHFSSRKLKIFLCKRRILPLEVPCLRGKALQNNIIMAKKAARKPNAAFMKPVTPDATLSAVVGSNPLPRTELTKKLWAYIKKNGLQDKKVRTQINADDKLKPVFGGKSKVSMFEMTKLVSGHVS